jgi:transaldolase
MALQNPLLKVKEFGQSIWLDYLSRTLIHSGQLQQLIENDGLSGVTSNPAIFQKAIGQSDAYDPDVRRLSREGKSAVEIYEGLAIGDIQEAADLLKSVHEQSQGMDGYISLEVSPALARDTEKTIEEVKRLWRAVARKNVMIKIPGTTEGLRAIAACTGEGINVNVTLLFGLDRYREVTDAFMNGLEERARRGGDLTSIRSVASFFLSRIDVLLDPQLQDKEKAGGKFQAPAQELRGQVAIASAKIAYEIYKEIFSGVRFRTLERQGARRQWLLWGSTSTKTKEYSDVKYVEALIGPETVNTMPLETLEAYRDHGSPERRLDRDVEAAHSVMRRLGTLGIDINQITQQLEDDGIEKFAKPFDELMREIDRKGHVLAA